ncbi:MAG TPA: IS21 family transposase [Longimicrobiales bacterium]|nr:IS21 family transposase [Longimicrobiales bacterium]
MAKLGKEQVQVAKDMVMRRVSVRQLARQFGVTEGALRYRLRRQGEAEQPDGRRNKPSLVNGYEAAIDALLERLEDGRVSGGQRPAQVRLIFEQLVRDYGYTGSYRSIVRYLRRCFGVPPVRALRRVETPPGVQAQHDWFEECCRIGGERCMVHFLSGVLSHSRGRFAWASLETTQVAWHTGHLALFERYGGVPLWIRIDHLKTGVIRSGRHPLLNPAYHVFARECGFDIDVCRVKQPSDKGKTERSVRTFRDAFGDLFTQDWITLDALQHALDERSTALAARLRCPITGTSVAAALQAERLVLQPVPRSGEPFDVVVSRRVARDCLVSFEGRRYSVPFAWVGRDVEILGVHGYVVIRAAGHEIARHARGTAALLVMDPAHFEGESTDRVIRPTPLGERARLQLAGLAGPARHALLHMPLRTHVRRPLSDYVALVEAAR